MSRRGTFWEETGRATAALRGCLMIPLGFVIYIGGFVALVAWGNSILILMLWMLFVGPIVVVIVAFGLTFALLLPVALLIAITMPFMKDDQ
jgi:hypothetical protein